MKKKIYLAGGMTGLDYDTAGAWRDDAAEALDIVFECFNPFTFDLTRTYRALEKTQDEIERTAMKYDLANLRNSDIVIYNDNAKSIGSSIELGIASELHIPIITLHESEEEIHPWIKELSIDVFDDFNLMISFIINYFQ